MSFPKRNSSFGRPSTGKAVNRTYGSTQDRQKYQSTVDMSFKGQDKKMTQQLGPNPNHFLKQDPFKENLPEQYIDNLQ
jgi:hypothetical protein